MSDSGRDVKVKKDKTCSKIHNVAALEVPTQANYRGVEPSEQVFPPKETDRNFELKRESISTKSALQTADTSKSLKSLRSRSERSESDKDSTKSTTDVLEVFGSDLTTSANSSPSVLDSQSYLKTTTTGTSEWSLLSDVQRRKFQKRNKEDEKVSHQGHHEAVRCMPGRVVSVDRDYISSKTRGFHSKQTDKNYEFKRESASTKSSSQVADNSKSLKSSRERSVSDWDCSKSATDVLEIYGRDWTTSANSSSSVSDSQSYLKTTTSGTSEWSLSSKNAIE